MSQKDDAGTEREQVPPPAVYRQLDDHLGPEEAPCDAESGLQRLRGWIGEQEPPDEARPQAEPVPEAEQQLRLAGMKLDAAERLAQKRISNARIALGAVVLVSVLAGLGLLFRLSYVPARVAMPVLVAVGAIDGAMTLAVVALYRTTMRGLHDDLRLAFGEPGRREKPDLAGQETTRPAARRGGGRPLVVRSGGGTYPPLLKFLAIIAFLGFAAACVVAYARDSLAPFTITSIVLAGLFLISVLPVVIPAIWAGEGPRRAAQAILYVMLGGQPVSYGEITARHAEMPGMPLADDHSAGSATASPRE
jgi:hypothetical protein